MMLTSQAIKRMIDHGDADVRDYVNGSKTIDSLQEAEDKLNDALVRLKNAKDEISGAYGAVDFATARYDHALRAIISRCKLVGGYGDSK